MDIESVRPVISGLIGGAIAIAFCRTISRWTPREYAGKRAESLVRQHRPAIWLANACLFSGLLAGIAIYQGGLLADDDWRGIAIGAGGGCCTALLVLPAIALLRGRRVRDAYVAYAMAQRTPAPLLYGALALIIGSFTAAATSLLTS